jgi:hypothetical protein
MQDEAAMKIPKGLFRALKTAVVATASIMQAKRLLEERDGPSVEVPAPPKPRRESRLMTDGPYRDAPARPSCTFCSEAVVAWCVICGEPIEIGERIFCPNKKPTTREIAEDIVPLYEIAAPKDHVHQSCAAAHAAVLFTRAIDDITTT